MLDNLKKDFKEAVQDLNFIKYFKDLEKRLYEVELKLYRTEIEDTIDQTIQRYKRLEDSKSKEWIPEEAVLDIDEKYVNDLSNIAMLLEMKYKDNDKIHFRTNFERCELILVYKKVEIIEKKKISKSKAVTKI
jgi:hypothetical protein